ncbi:MAG: SpoVA/SpoVAEb family sporulation membrane protein [Peptococcaceae bacterium]|jgi:stage V sporulation protein AE|nr:SpoVA/SpoVAEb family sporulation membrane protein [Peptococcaceae bacterium]
MRIVQAFICGGVICVIGQVLLIYVNISPPRILLGALILGALLSPFGAMRALTDWGGGGLIAMAIGCGGAFYDISAAALQGEFAPAVLVILLFGFLLVMGAVAGCIASKMNEVRMDK